MSSRFTTDYLGIVLTMVLLLSMIALSLFKQIDPLTKAEGSTYNNGRSGTNTLYNWLDDLGYRVRTQTAGDLLPTTQDSLLFVIKPNKDFSAAERQRVVQWVINGGTLIWVQENRQTRTMQQLFGVTTRRIWPPVQQARLTLPTLNWPLVGNMVLNTGHRIQIDCGQAAIHVGNCDNPLLLSFGQGRGQVYLISSLYPFTNEGLNRGSNAQLVRNLVQLNAASGSRILFDDAHHQAASFWLVQTPGGWAAILLVALLLTYGWQSNQRFGNPRPTLVKDNPERRETAAFISHLAAAQKELDPEWRIRRHYWQRLKRRLAQRFSTDPQLANELFLAELRPYLDELQISQLIYLNTQLDRQPMSQTDLQLWITQILTLQEKLNETTTKISSNLTK